MARKAALKKVKQFSRCVVLKEEKNYFEMHCKPVTDKGEFKIYLYHKNDKNTKDIIKKYPIINKFHIYYEAGIDELTRTFNDLEYEINLLVTSEYYAWEYKLTGASVTEDLGLYITDFAYRWMCSDIDCALSSGRQEV